MDIPDKIYLYRAGEELDNRWWFTNFSKNNIEYIRTDTFINKTVKWLKENITNNPNATQVISRKGCVTMGMLIEDFCKSIKRM